MKVKVKVKIKERAPEKISIDTEYIKLDSFLKYAAIAATGGEAKEYIAQEKIKINGDICTQRGKKLRNGDIVWAEGRSYVVVSEGEE